MSETIELEIGSEQDGRRLDKVVIAHVRGLGRRRAAQLFERGRVTIDGQRVKKGDLAHAGQRLIVELGGPDHAQPDPEAALTIVLETEDVVIASKPAGQPTAPLSGEERGTLANALVARYPEMAEVGFGRREPGLLHRLDTQTSGLVIAARNAQAFERLRRALAAGELDKRYLAVVAAAELGESGVVDQPLLQDRRHPERVLIATSDTRSARRATTRWRMLERAERFALLEVSAPRAFRHQIRAHLASIGHPIAGDALYGGPAASELGARHALHASHVAWSGDDRLPGFTADDPMPDEMRALLSG